MTPSNTELARVVPVPQAAVRLGWSRERVIRAIQRRSIAGTQIDGKWHVDGESLARAIAAQKRAAKRSD